MKAVLASHTHTRGLQTVPCEDGTSLSAVMELLFSEELGLVLEVSESDVDEVSQRYSDAGVLCRRIGRTCGFGPEAIVSLFTCCMFRCSLSFWCNSASHVTPLSCRSVFEWTDKRC